MDRSLDLARLEGALGEGLLLPTPLELQSRLAQAEIALLLGRGEVDDELVATAWYLHAVGSALGAADLYSADRQFQAHQVSAHIFDLALSSQDAQQDSSISRLQQLFAAQVGYMRGGQNPNASALYRRERIREASMLESPGGTALEVGIRFLALDRARLFPRLEALRLEAGRLQSAIAVPDLIETPYGAAARVVEAVRELLIHFTYNRPERLERALELLTEAVDAPHSQDDIDSRWTASHLRDIGQELAVSSVWSMLPDGGADSAARAMTMGEPPVLALWPPQVEFLSSEPSPLDPRARRMTISFPTSAGKTLLAQYIALAHVASGAGSVCVVVPTHSLAREIRRDFDRRMDLLEARVGDAGPVGVASTAPGAVTIMTPEKLLNLIRQDPSRVLTEYNLFLIDEAQLVGDRSRGWALEAAISFLHNRTLRSEHRIVLLSAALGNRAHVRAWIDPGDGSSVVAHHDWRGPRRVLALLNTDAQWDSAVDNPPTRKRMLHRRTIPLIGQISVRTAGGRISLLTTNEPIGELTQVRRDETDVTDETWERHTNESTPGYRMRALMATYLGAHGPLLAVEPTKAMAQRLAQAIADHLDGEDVVPSPLAAVAATRLGDAHPLVATLGRGVGFHHAALPDDIQAELEDGLKTGKIRYLASTTTLIEGMNFPVRTVLIGDRGYMSREGYVETIDAPKLVNTVGRAGRAGRETEGWVVMWLSKRTEAADFRLLESHDDDLVATSNLAAAEGLATLAEFEELLRISEDAVFEYSGREVAYFSAHVWFIADALAELGDVGTDPVAATLESTLAWQQLGDADRERWRDVAESSLAAYSRTDPARRRRWSRTGTAIPTSAALEALAGRTLQDMPAEGQQEPLGALRLIAQDGRLREILDLGEAGRADFRPRRNSPRSQQLDVDAEQLIFDWVAGRGLRDICEDHLGAVPDETYRYEQLSEFVSSVIEHWLPWALSTITAWVNEDASPAQGELCSELASYVRYGVDSGPALELMRGGVRSRRLAHVVGARYPADQASLREWLVSIASRDFDSWRLEFGATPTEVSDLLSYTRIQDAFLTSKVLSGQSVEVPVVLVGQVEDGPVHLQQLDGRVPAQIVATREGVVVATTGADYHEDLGRLLAVAMPIAALLRGEHLVIRSIDLVDAPGWFEARTE